MPAVLFETGPMGAIGSSLGLMVRVVPGVAIENSLGLMVRVVRE